MKRTIIASALSLTVALGAVTPAFAQDVIIRTDGSVEVINTPTPGQTFTTQLPSGEVVTLQAQAVTTPAVTTTTTTAGAATAGGTAAGGATAGTVTTTVAAGGGLAGGVGLTALAALAAVGIVAAISSSSDTN